MRKDMVSLVKQAVAENRCAYVLVNNGSEGNAPLTVQTLSDLLRAEHRGVRLSLRLSTGYLVQLMGGWGHASGPSVS